MTTAEAQTQLATVQGLGLMEAYRSASKRTGIPTEVLLGKDSRESKLTLALGQNCTGDGGNGFGISQIDTRFYPSFTAQVDPCNHYRYIQKGADVLRADLDALGGRLRPALAAYNAGRLAVREAEANGRDVDSVTTGGDYSRDVLQKAQQFRRLTRQFTRQPTARQSTRQSTVPIPLVLGGLLGAWYFIK